MFIRDCNIDLVQCCDIKRNDSFIIYIFIWLILKKIVLGLVCTQLMGIRKAQAFTIRHTGLRQPTISYGSAYAIERKPLGYSHCPFAFSRSQFVWRLSK